MNGIEIISTSTETEFLVVPFLSITIFTMIAFVVIALCEHWDVGFAVIPTCLGLIFGCGIYGLIFHEIFPTEYNTYKVTISENVSMTEFYEKYEIIDTDGEIFTVRERETE